jgi:Fic family protein
VQPSDFTSDSPGELVPTEGGAWAFAPNQLPRKLPLAGSTVRLLGRANHALGELSGVARLIKNPYLLGSALLRREAILSSRIEGTTTSPEQLVLFEAGAPFEKTRDREDAQEVLNYVLAMQRGLHLLKKLPVSLRFIRELHAVLLHGVRGEREHPGQFRTCQNWIGRKSGSIRDATFVPPPVKEMGEALDDLEKFIHLEPHADIPDPLGSRDDPDLPPIVIRQALIHYQFEAIHPFRDGNGRVGRLLVPLLFISHGLLKAPLLYLSAYFERHRSDYHALLFAVSQRGAWNEWVDFFLRGVEESANESIRHADALIALRERWKARFEKARSPALLHKLIDHLFDTPAIRIGDAKRLLGVTTASASAIIKKLVEAGIVAERTGRMRGQVFVAADIVKLIGDADAGS